MGATRGQNNTGGRTTGSKRKPQQVYVPKTAAGALVIRENPSVPVIAPADIVQDGTLMLPGAVSNDE
jgi:hypothetical protein